MFTQRDCWVCLSEAEELKPLNAKFGQKTMLEAIHFEIASNAKLGHLTILEAINFVVNFNIEVDDDLPNKICYNCEILLDLAVIFKQRCLESQKIIRLSCPVKDSLEPLEDLSITPLNRNNSLPASIEDEVKKQITQGNDLVVHENVRISNKNEKTSCLNLPIRKFAGGSKCLENNFNCDVEKTTELVNQKATKCGTQDIEKADNLVAHANVTVTKKKESKNCVIADQSYRVIGLDYDAIGNIEAECSGNDFHGTECLHNIGKVEDVISREVDPPFRVFAGGSKCPDNNFDFYVEKTTKLVIQKPTKSDVQDVENEVVLPAYSNITSSENKESNKSHHEYNAVGSIESESSNNYVDDTEFCDNIEKVQDIISRELDPPFRVFAASKCNDNNFDAERITKLVNQKPTKCGIQNVEKEDDMAVYGIVTVSENKENLIHIAVVNDYDAVVNINSECFNSDFDDNGRDFDVDVEKTTKFAIQKANKCYVQDVEKEDDIAVYGNVTYSENKECQKYIMPDLCFRVVNHGNGARVNMKSEHSGKHCDDKECLHSNFDCDLAKTTELHNQKSNKSDIRDMEKEDLAAYTKVTVSQMRASQKYVMAASYLRVILDHDYDAVVNIVSKCSGNDFNDTEDIGNIEIVQNIVSREVDKTKTIFDVKTARLNCSKIETLDQIVAARKGGEYKGGAFTTRNWCQDCPAKFSTREAFLKHRTIHNGQEPELCAICGKLISLSSVKEHIKRHKSNMDFKCDRCDKQFVTWGERKSHYRVHTRERPYHCKVCGRGFSTTTGRNTHEAIHSDERPFKCDLCPKRFKISVCLRYHRLSHTGERAYPCPVCNAAFRRSYERLYHLKRHSKDTPNIDEVIAQLRNKRGKPRKLAKISSLV